MQLPNSYSNYQYWIDWHKYLVKTLDKSNANDTFMRNWQVVGQNSSSGNDPALRAYMKTQGVEIKGEYGVLSSLSDSWQSVNSGAKKIGGTAQIGVFIIILMLVGAVYFLFIKD